MASVATPLTEGRNSEQIRQDDDLRAGRDRMARSKHSHFRYPREYWSRRARGKGAWDLSWGRVGKWITHRFEHAAKRRIERKILKGDTE